MMAMLALECQIRHTRGSVFLSSFRYPDNSSGHAMPFPLYQSNISSPPKKYLSRSDTVLPFLAKVPSIDNAIHSIVAQVWMNPLNRSVQFSCRFRPLE
jgi:hypothetical protein